MNFDNMPELKTRYGYYSTLLVMVLVTIGLLLYFWQRGWIFQRDDEKEIVSKEEKHSATADPDQLD